MINSQNYLRSSMKDLEDDGLRKYPRMTDQKMLKNDKLKNLYFHLLLDN